MEARVVVMAILEEPQGLSPGRRLHSINAAGDGVCTLVTRNGIEQAYRWHGGSLTQLDPLKGRRRKVSHLYATGINAHGAIIGSFHPLTEVAASRGFVLSSSGTVVLGTLGGNLCCPCDVDDSGNIVGWSSLPGNRAVHAFHIAAPGPLRDLGTLGGRNSYAYAINDYGQIVGVASTSDGRDVAFISEDFQMRSLLESHPFDESCAWDINAAGQVVGSWRNRGHSAGCFLHDRTGVHLLDKPANYRDYDMYPSRLNAHGHIVGSLSMFDPSLGELGRLTSRGFAYAEDRFIDLSQLPEIEDDWTIVEATDVNDSGQIVAWAVNEQTTAVVLLSGVFT